MADLDFSGKTVLVIGGSSGIGNGIAHAFRLRGAIVHVTGTRASAGDYRVGDGSDLSGLAYAPLDVTAPGAVAAFSLTAARLDVLVLSQGTVLYKRGEFEMDGFRKVMEVNLTSLMACASKFHPMLKASGGSLIIVSSTAAFHATRGNPAYNASKTGAVGLTRTLAVAWAEDGIRVNGVAPGGVDTPIIHNFGPPDDADYKLIARLMTPIGFAFPHGTVDHSKHQYVVGAVHTQTIEGFWSIFKRGIVGTFHNVSKRHLHLYVAEFQFRYNNRFNDDILGATIEGC